MKALTQSSVVGEPLAGIYQRVAALVAGESQGAVEATDVAFQQAPEHTGGDLSFPCFPLAKAWKRNPAQIAGEMASALNAAIEKHGAESLLEKAEAAGPYLNLRLDRGAVSRLIVTEVISSERRYGDSDRQAGDKVMMEYVSPNTNKPLHLGHVRNAVLGRTVANLIESQGATMHRTDIINDRGIHIAKSMLAYKRFGEGETPESAGVKGDHFVGKYYVKFDKALTQEKEAWLESEGVDLSSLDERGKKKVQERFLGESELMGETREILKKWEAEDEEVRALWRQMNGWVYDGFGQTYARMGIDFDKHYYESDVYQGGREVIMAALEAGTFQQADNGAIIAPLSRLEGKKLQDKVVIRGDGTGLYITQDINLATIKFEEFGLNRSYYCIGSEQNYYMRQLKATLEMLGFRWASGMEHLSYGMVYLPEGKMKSREGNVVDADDLMAQMAKMATEAVRERYPDLADEEALRRGEGIGLAAIVFSLLMVGRETDIHFDPKASLAFEGKTGPYLQYVYARISSILKKAGDFTAPTELALDEDEAWSLLRGLLFYPTVVADAAESLDPSRLTSFLIEQTQAFNAFYREHRVLDAEEPRRSSRLVLLQAFRKMLGHGFGLLAIEALEEM